MRRVLVSGLVAGLAGGVVLATLLTVVVPTTPGLPMRSLMRLLAGAAGSDSAMIGWIITLVLGALVGLVLAAIAGYRGRSGTTVMGPALIIGAVVWLAALFVGVPLLFAVSPVAVPITPEFWPLAMFLCVASLLFISAVAAVFVGMASRPRRDDVRETRKLRRAA